MATTIRILPENLCNKIAAGEVVERPASVAKELVENALDSGTREVVVEIESGGKRLIKVTDTGCGMSREDALLALERHATSKIARDEDLFSLATLGFRGEALPSIASVSRLTIGTRCPDTVEGTEIYAEGGRIKEVKGCGMASGTVITVRNLFFNTPARLKFMKSPETEAGHVGELLTRLAISRPEVRFTYHCDGKVVFRALDSDLKERVATLLGRSIAASLYPVSYQDPTGLKVSGLVAAPHCCRSAASHLYTYINGRFIRDKVVQHAVLQAYRNFLERGRYPVVALFIDIDPAEVDVNVHPTKHEVRFREQGRVHDAIQGAVEAVLRQTPWLRRESAREGGERSAGGALRAADSGVREPVVPAPAGSEPASAARVAPERADVPDSAARVEGAEDVSAARVAEVRELLQSYRPGAQASRPRYQQPDLPQRSGPPATPTHSASSGHAAAATPFALPVQAPSPARPGPAPIAADAGTGEPVAQAVAGAGTAGYFSSLSVIGQFNAAYILCQQGSDLVLIDQHAAHERVAFEKLKGQFTSRQIDSQGLLFPDTVDLSFKEAATLREHREELERLGFALEEFGGSTWLLQGVPQMLAEGQYLRLLRDILEELGSLNRSRTFSDVQEDLLARIACHSVVRGRRNLTHQEIVALFSQMDDTDFSSNCPHGRPVLQKITLSEIEKMFKRG